MTGNQRSGMVRSDTRIGGPISEIMPRECRGTSVNYHICNPLAQAASESPLRHRPAGYRTEVLVS